MLGPAVHHGKDTAHKTLETMCNAHVCPQQCWKAVQMDPTLLRYASAITEQIRMLRSCWLKSLTCFKLCSTTHNNLQQGVQTDAHCEIQKCWELLANNMLHAFAWGFKGIKSTNNDVILCGSTCYDKITIMNKGIAVLYSRGMTFSTPRDP